MNNMSMNWKIISSEYISEHKYFRARKDTCEMPDGKIVASYYVVEIPVSACALAITEDGKAIMVKQYRHPIGKAILEIPGGFIDKGEDPVTAIARELMEETGYEFSQIDHVGKIAANPGILNEYTHLFLARGGKKVSGQKLDDNEEIDIILMPVEEVRQLLLNNEIEQALHTSCLLYAFQKLDSEK
jgi:ADP-ribose pyrophosphatase